MTARGYRMLHLSPRQNQPASLHFGGATQPDAVCHAKSAVRQRSHLKTIWKDRPRLAAMRGRSGTISSAPRAPPPISADASLPEMPHAVHAAVIVAAVSSAEMPPRPVLKLGDEIKCARCGFWHLLEQLEHPHTAEMLFVQCRSRSGSYRFVGTVGEVAPQSVRTAEPWLDA